MLLLGRVAMNTAEDNHEKTKKKTIESELKMTENIEFLIHTLLVTLKLTENKQCSRLKLMSIHYILRWHTAFEIISHEMLHPCFS